METFKYALVGSPFLKLPKEGEKDLLPLLRVSTSADRVKWLCQPGPFDFKSVGTDFIELRRNGSFSGSGNIGEVRFQIYPSQTHASKALSNNEVHFVPAITDPTCIPAKLERWQAPSHYNLQYVGFRINSRHFKEPEDRKRFVTALDVNEALNVAGIPDWKAEALLPGIPGVADFNTSAQERERSRAELRRRFASDRPKLVYNSNEPIHDAIAKYIARQTSVDLVEKPGFDALVEGVQNGEGDLFLYNWYVKTLNLRRVLYPLFHSKSIPHPNLTRYGNADVEIDQLLDAPIVDPTNNPALNKIYGDVPIFVLYHARRTAAWRNVTGLYGNLTDPECNPKDKLQSVMVRSTEP